MIYPLGIYISDLSLYYRTLHVIKFVIPKECESVNLILKKYLRHNTNKDGAASGF